jgi:hypothetical protein
MGRIVRRIALRSCLAHILFTCLIAKAQTAPAPQQRFHLDGIWQIDLLPANGYFPAQFRIAQEGESFKLCRRKEYKDYCWAGRYTQGSRTFHIVAEGEVFPGATKEWDVVIDNPDRIHGSGDKPNNSIIRHSLPRADDAPCDDGNTAQVEFFYAFLRAQDAVQKKDLTRTACWLHIGAVDGDARSQSLYSSVLYTGEGIARDYPAAFQWAQKGAQKGYFLGEFMLAIMYRTGNGTPVNREKSKEWMAKFQTGFQAEVQRQRQEAGSSAWNSLTDQQRLAVVRAGLAVFSQLAGASDQETLIRNQQMASPNMSRSMAESLAQRDPNFKAAQEQEGAGMSTILNMVLGLDPQLNKAAGKAP